MTLVLRVGTVGLLGASLLGSLGIAKSAEATPVRFRVDFQATGFSGFSQPVPPPTDLVAGYFVFEYDDQLVAANPFILLEDLPTVDGLVEVDGTVYTEQVSLVDLAFSAGALHIATWGEAGAGGAIDTNNYLGFGTEDFAVQVGPGLQLQSPDEIQVLYTVGQVNQTSFIGTTGTWSIQQVPEPAGALLLLSGLLALGRPRR